MKITTITVSSQRKLPHPSVDFANISGFVSLTAELGEDDNPKACAVRLQDEADAMVDSHVQAIAAKWSIQQRKQQDALVASKAQAETANTAARLAEKHGAAR